MIYRDYSRKAGEWIPNVYGGRENLEAIAFLRRLNEVVYGGAPGRARRSRRSPPSWPQVSRPIYLGGLGFGFKWNMGWMHDMLEFMHHEPVHRKYHHNQLTFGLLYAWTENFVLPLSHDEVVHGKGSLAREDAGRRLAALREPAPALRLHVGVSRARSSCSWAASSASRASGTTTASLDWHLLETGPYHRGAPAARRRPEPPLSRASPRSTSSTPTRRASAGWTATTGSRAWCPSAASPRDRSDLVLCVANFTPVVREGYRVGVPRPGYYARGDQHRRRRATAAATSATAAA